MKKSISLALCILAFLTIFGCGEVVSDAVDAAEEPSRAEQENTGVLNSEDDAPVMPGSDEIAGESGGKEDEGGFPFEFTAKDLYGNTVTEKSLGEKQLFFVHYWATWCGPCVGEMPDLAETVEDYGDKVGFIALVDDYGSNLSGAVEIVEWAGVPASFIMVDAETPELESVMSMLKTGYVPTTVILTPNGDMIEPKLIGAYGAEYAGLLDILLGQGE